MLRPQPPRSFLRLTACPISQAATCRNPSTAHALAGVLTLPSVDVTKDSVSPFFVALAFGDWGIVMSKESANIRSNLAEATDALDKKDIPLDQRVKVGANKLWSAMFDRDYWPPDMIAEAEQVMRRVLVNGPVDRSVPEMDETTLKGLAVRIRSLAARAHAAVSRNEQHERGLSRNRRPR